MALLAQVSDVQAILGRDLTTAESARADTILNKLSELFILESGQQFVSGTSTVRLKVNGGEVYLPQRPAGDITSVKDEAGAEIPYTRLSTQWIAVPLSSARMVWVTYSHGGAVPDVVRLQIADDARQVLQIAPEAVSGQSQITQTSGPYSQSGGFATWAQGGQVRLSIEGQKLARSFRVTTGNVWVK